MEVLRATASECTWVSDSNGTILVVKESCRLYAGHRRSVRGHVGDVRQGRGQGRDVNLALQDSYVVTGPTSAADADRATWVPASIIRDRRLSTDRVRCRRAIKRESFGGTIVGGGTGTRPQGAAPRGRSQDSWDEWRIERTQSSWHKRAPFRSALDKTGARPPCRMSVNACQRIGGGPVGPAPAAAPFPPGVADGPILPWPSGKAVLCPIDSICLRFGSRPVAVEENSPQLLDNVENFFLHAAQS